MNYSMIEMLKLVKTKNNNLKIGDKMKFELYTGEKVEAEIVGFNHDLLANRKGNARATFRFTIDGKFEMNEDWTNIGGWGKSKMRNAYCKRLFKLLPIELQKAIKPVIKETTAGGASKELVETKDKLFLFSLAETIGNDGWLSYVEEGKQYELFKKKGYSFKKWSWLRSPLPSSPYYFHYVSSGGGGSNYFADISYGVCFAFAI